MGDSYRWRGCGFNSSPYFIVVDIKRKRRRIKTRREVETRGSAQPARRKRAKTKRRIENGSLRVTKM